MMPAWLIIIIVIIAACAFGLLYIATFRTKADFEDLKNTDRSDDDGNITDNIN